MWGRFGCWIGRRLLTRDGVSDENKLICIRLRIRRRLLIRNVGILRSGGTRRSAYADGPVASGLRALENEGTP